MIANTLQIIEKYENSEDLPKEIPVLTLESIDWVTELTDQPANEGTRAGVLENGSDSDNSVIVIEDDGASEDNAGSHESVNCRMPQSVGYSLKESEEAVDIKDLFKPLKDNELTSEEEWKNQLRRQRNRESAMKSRLKRIERERKLQQKYELLEEQNSSLLEEVRKLQTTKSLLQAISKRINHSTSCKLKAVRPTALLQPTYISVNSLPERLRKAFKQKSERTLLDSRQENVRTRLPNCGFDRLVKRKADVQGPFQQPSKVQAFSKKTTEESVNFEEVPLSSSAHEANFVNGQFGKTYPVHPDDNISNIFRLTEDHVCQTGSSSLSDSSNSKLLKQFREPQCNSAGNVRSVSEEGNTLPSVQNIVTSGESNPDLPVPCSLIDSQTTRQCFPTTTFDLELPRVADYRGSTNVEEQDDDSEARIKHIRDHLFDDLPNKCPALSLG